MQTTPLRVKRPHTKAIRLMLVSRSSRLKPRPLLRCVRTISPSSTSTLRPRSFKRCSIISDRVLLPEPERPVNQIVKPLFAMLFMFSLMLIGRDKSDPYNDLRQGRDKSGPCNSLENVSLHIGWDGNIQLLKNGRCHIHQLQAGQLAT